jgi:hypothetical protein
MIVSAMETGVYLCAESTAEELCVCVLEQALALSNDPRLGVPRVLDPVHVAFDVVVRVRALNVALT